MSHEITKWVQEFPERSGDKLTVEELDLLKSVYAETLRTSIFACIRTLPL